MPETPSQWLWFVFFTGGSTFGWLLFFLFLLIRYDRKQTERQRRIARITQREDAL
jgi:hypothetical protein